MPTMLADVLNTLVANFKVSSTGAALGDDAALERIYTQREVEKNFCTPSGCAPS